MYKRQILDNAQLIKLKAILTDIIDEQTDSLRFYNLGINILQKWTMLVLVRELMWRNH